MEIKRIGSQPSSKGPPDWFTGTVRIDPLFQVHPPARANGASVTFEPGARTLGHPSLRADVNHHRPAAAGCNKRGVPWKRCIQATWSGSRPPSGIGMALHRRQR